MNSHAPNPNRNNRSFKRRSKKDNVLLRQQEAASALHLQEPLHSENVDKMHAVYASAVDQRLIEEVFEWHSAELDVA